MICPNHYCVQELRKNAKFCQRCGFNLIIASRKLTYAHKNKNKNNNKNELSRKNDDVALVIFVGFAMASSVMLFLAVTEDSPAVIANIVEPVTIVEPPSVLEPDFSVVQKYPASLENLIKDAVQEKNLGGVEFFLKEFYNSVSETSAGIGRLADTGDLEAAIAETDELIVLMKSVRSLIGGLTIREMSGYPVLKKHLILLDRGIMRLQELRNEMGRGRNQ